MRRITPGARHAGSHGSRMGLRGRAAAFLSVCTLACSAGRVEAYSVNFGTPYVPDVGHGQWITAPSWPAGSNAFAAFNYVGFGIADRWAGSVDATYLALPGTLANVTFTAHYDAGEPLPGLKTRLAPQLGLPLGGQGGAVIGFQAYFARALGQRLMNYTALATAYNVAGGTSLTLNTAFDQRLSDRLSVGLEVLAGTPTWGFGPDARVGVAPTATLYMGPYTFSGALRVPVVGTRAPAGGSPTWVAVFVYDW